jgi:bifunctional non-homologous end joining protein LigD
MERHPDKLTTQVRKADRMGRLFVDTLRNAYAQHAVAPYSVRPLPGAPVATPLAWAELDDPKLTAQRYTIRDIEKRLAGGDPWHGMGRRAPSLTRARTRLANMAAG